MSITSRSLFKQLNCYGSVSHAYFSLAGNLPAVAMSAITNVAFPVTDAQKSHILHLLKACDGALVSGARALINYLLHEKIAHYMVIDPCFIGTHFDNRDGFGVDAMAALELLTALSRLGWDDAEAKGIVVETSPQIAAEALTFNQQQVAASRNQLAPIKDVIKFLTISGSHTVQALRALAAGVPWTDPSLTVDGKLSVDKAALTCPGLANAAVHGYKMLVLPAWLTLIDPTVFRVLQSAQNAPGHLAKGENMFQVMRKMHRMARVSSDSQQMSYLTIKNYVMKSEIRDKAHVPFMYNMITKFSGGTSMPHLVMAEMHAHRVGNYTINVDVLDVLSRDFKGINQIQILRWAWLSLALGDTALEHKQKQLAIKDRDLIKFNKPEPMKHAIAAEERIRNFEKSVAFVAGNTNADVMHALQCMRNGIGAIVINKANRPDTGVTTIDDAIRKCMVSIEQSTGIKVQTDLDRASADDSQATSNVVDDSVRIRVDDEDLTSTIMAKMGFSNDDTVVNKESDVHYQIVKFAAGRVYLNKLDDTTAETSTSATSNTNATPIEQTVVDVVDFQSKTYKLYKRKEVGDSRIVNWHLQNPTNNFDFGVSITKAHIIASIGELVEKHYATWEHVDLYSKPKKTVVNATIPANKLVVIPVSMTINHMTVTENSKPQAKNVVIEHTKFKDTNVVFFMVPMSQEECQVEDGKSDMTGKRGLLTPYLFVSETNKEDEANMVKYNVNALVSKT